jgi:lysozyme family protein
MTYSKRFEQAFTHIIAIEGGYVNDPDDPGGETIYGIARNYWPQYWRKGTPTVDMAKVFYATQFWGPLRCEEYASDPVALEIFDTSVNLGITTGVEVAQNACIVLGQDIAADGRLGPVTVGAINAETKKSERELLLVLNGIQLGYYISQARKSKRAKKYLNGWRKRCLLPQVRKAA